tara:strand:- start:539 stop:1060 length:522 start_codon:yes stop_codon:yes gene_type:complete
MAKDFLNVIERALMMGISDTINSAVTGDVFVYGEFPDTEDLKFPAIVVQQAASGFEEQLMGQKQSFGGASGSGEIYGVAFTTHIILEKDTSITIDTTDNGTPDTEYKQRRLLNWFMLNIANAVLDIDWDVYKEDSLEVHERHLQQWRNIGFIRNLEWYGASADFLLTFSNYRG